MVRSPHAHARVRRIDAAAALRAARRAGGGDGGRHRRHPEAVAGPHAEPGAGHHRPPRRAPHAAASRRSATSARWWRRSWPSRAPSPRTRAIWSRSTTTPCPSSPPRAAALAPGAPLVYEELGDNVAAHIVQRVGQPERAFAAADHTLRETFRVMRGGSHSMEGRGVVARYDEALDAFTVWDATQAPHAIRAMLAYLFELPEHRVRVIAPPDVGGGLGPKASFYPEEALVCWLARRLRRPVKWIEDRLEHFLSAAQEREQIHTVEIAFTQRRHPARAARRLHPRHRHVRRAGRAGHHRLHRARPLPHPEHPLRGPRRLHQPAADRRGARRRPPAGRARDGADDGPHGRDARPRPRRRPLPQPDPGRRVPVPGRHVVPRRRAPHLRQRQLPRAAAPGPRAAPTTPQARREQARAPRGGPLSRHRRGDLRRGRRPRAVRGRGPAARRARPRDRDQRRAAAGPGLPDRLRPDRRRRGRRPLRGRRRGDRRHRRHPLRRRQLRQPRHRQRRARRSCRPAASCARRSSPSAAHLLEAAAGDLEIVDGAVRVRGLPDRGVPLAQVARLGNARRRLRHGHARRPGGRPRGLRLLHAVAGRLLGERPRLHPGRRPRDRRGRRSCATSSATTAAT